ncbi:GFA family protein [Sphingomonas sp.]|uniref:GFA family protein n=1 Tax=Sphingomonas sp. TaxID=28214 RepID=UPI00286D4563|nr:GFA family protein [Sphingomonas sp.]
MMMATGSCHCGAVRFSARLPAPPIPALDCNCSVCTMTGFLHVIVPHEEFVLLSGTDVLVSYRFGTGAAEHLFCSRCGVKSFYQPRTHATAWSVNARCLDVPPTLAVEVFDGRDWDNANAALHDGAAR